MKDVQDSGEISALQRALEKHEIPAFHFNVDPDPDPALHYGDAYL